MLADQLGNRFVDLQFMFSMECRALVERSLSVKQAEGRLLSFRIVGVVVTGREPDAHLERLRLPVQLALRPCDVKVPDHS